MAGGDVVLEALEAVDDLGQALADVLDDADLVRHEVQRGHCAGVAAALKLAGILVGGGAVVGARAI